MTFEERNEQITEPITKTMEELKDVHDKFTSSTRIMTEEDWNAYKGAMDKILAVHVNTRYYHLAEELWMFFLDDTEFVQKELKKIEKSRTDKTA